jgi:hypothetical protein
MTRQLKGQRVYVGYGICLSKFGTIFRFPVWFRTLPKHGYSSEQIVRLSIQSQRDTILSKSNRCLLLGKLLATKFRQFQSIDQQLLDP